MQTTCALPSEQALRANLDANGVFNLITDDRFVGVIEAHLPAHRERTYPPTETLSMFVAQVLNDDISCQRAINERIARCLQHGLRAPSTSTAAYFEARRPLPTTLVEALYKAVGAVGLHVSDNAPEKSLWRGGRRVLFIDGTGVTMPDTAANQQAFPQPSSQRPGVGFPEARMVALSGAATGAIIDTTIGPAKGKTTGELSQMRTLSRSLRPEDVLVGDAIYETFWTFLMVQGIGCDGVFEINGSRTHRVKRHRDYQPRVFLTTLRNSQWVSDKQIVKLYLLRWNVETDFTFAQVRAGCWHPDLSQSRDDREGAGGTPARLQSDPAADERGGSSLWLRAAFDQLSAYGAAVECLVAERLRTGREAVDSIARGDWRTQSRKTA